MFHVITQSCCSDAGCVSVCPVNCIHPTPEERGFGTSDILHIDPETCIDCGACADACPVDAIFPADRLGERDKVFIEINADFYRRNPDVSSAWSGVVYPDIPRLPSGLRVAVVGTGPSGGYALQTILGRTDAYVTVLDRLLTPGGLVRAGVAPDHPGTKGVLRSFDLLYRDPRVELLGGVTVGGEKSLGQVSPAELAEHFDAVFYAVGAADSKRLGIPGESLPGSTSATDLVAWYNAMSDPPGAEAKPADPPIPSGDVGRAVIVGTGNVALDVARILVSSPEALATTDIADRALERLRQQDMHEVVLLGRRGRDQAACTPAEYRALESLPGVDVVVCDDPAEFAALDLDRPATAGRRRIVALFHTAPTEVLAGESGRASGVAVTTGGLPHEIAADLVVRSIGYRGVEIDGLPFDASSGVIPSEGGRVISEDGAPIPGTYVIGWAARGATGGIGANKAHAVGTVEAFIDDAAAGRLPRASREAGEFAEMLRNRTRDVVGYREIEAIDRAERERGRVEGRPRVKFTEVAEMLVAAHKRR